ncbi:hypothetical protein D3C77_302840 [compost metagenome]
MNEALGSLQRLAFGLFNRIFKSFRIQGLKVVAIHRDKAVIRVHVAFLEVIQTFAEILSEGFGHIRRQIMIEFVGGYTAVLRILLGLKNDRHKRHRRHDRVRRPYAAVTGVESLPQQLVEWNEDAIRRPNRILIQVVNINKIVLNRLNELFRHDEVACIPLRVFAAELAQFSREAFAV